LNPALDEAVALETLVLGHKNRCSLDSLDAGGKGINASRVIHRLSRDTIALGFAGGVTGELLRQKLDDEAVPHQLWDVPEATRVNIMIYERRSGRRSRLYLPGPQVHPMRLVDLEMRLDALLPGSVVVFGGSVPPGLPATVYRDLIRLVKPHGIRTIVDASGEALAAALDAAPELIKPNVSEASELLERSLPDDAAVLAAARELRARGAEHVVISQGERGAIGVNAAGAWKAVPPKIHARSTVGSGDSMVAGLAIALDEGQPLIEGLRLGTATGAATAMIPGTRLCRAQDVQTLLGAVTIHEVAVAA
jgi:1-phosphofructokinase family hexose kinase